MFRRSPPYNETIAISRHLAKARTAFTVQQKKIMALALTQIRWAEDGNSNLITLDKDTCLRILGYTVTQGNRHDSYKQLKRIVSSMPDNSRLNYSNRTDEHLPEYLIQSVSSNIPGKLLIEINPDCMKYLENLCLNPPFITANTSDIFGLSSKHAFALWEKLISHCDSGIEVNVRGYTTKQLKEVFGLDINQYTAKTGKDHAVHFNRAEFEHSVLNKAIDEINKGKMLVILSAPDNSGLFYEKKKEDGRVKEYVFRYRISDRYAFTAQRYSKERARIKDDSR